MAAAKHHTTLNLWLTYLLPLFAWLMHLSASYLIAIHACGSFTFLWLLHLLTFAAAALVLLGAWCGYRALQDGKAEADRDKVHLAQIALSLAALYLLIILVSEISNFLLEPCQ